MNYKQCLNSLRTTLVYSAFHVLKHTFYSVASVDLFRTIMKLLFFKGAQEEGVEGFFKGVGKGIMGLLTKPTGGVFDMVSMAFDGLQRAAELENSIVHRMRKPRFINPYLVSL